MKAHTIKLPVFLLSIFFVALLSCGEQSATNSTTTEVTDTLKTEEVALVPATDSMPAIEHTAITKQDINNDIKIIEPVIVAKTTTVKPAVTAPKTAPVATPATTTTTTTTTTVTPPVVVPEPVKPAPPVKPATAEVPKPVTVTPPAPVKTDWPVPANYRTMKSPYAADPASIALGKTVYGTHCKSCHGSKGDGNGPKASSLDTEMRSFLSSGFKSQAIGEVFYKTIFGRKDMPKYDKKIPEEEERWAVVNYIRSF